ncbi:ABC transporter permease [Saccharothrix longispora]|uniref:ABC transporter permease n=1 Tax=Saccharothrix longispora TaxID=33920 RepID=UPI0028FD5827|nr:ABC transporter permease [Saccharothrix longispora]MBY8849144.1 ABC transporter permease [Saccharothrix sp. MB29]MDU0293476.1 ABC transporter permease [Saccharothrix longispora]
MTVDTRVRRASWVSVLQRQGATVALVLMVVVAWVSFPRFGSLDNVRDIALQSSFLAIIALGMTFVIITGGIDLSVGSVYALGGVLAAYGSQWGFAAALLLPLAVCGLIGLLNGVLVAKTGMAPFIVTLATLLFARGLLLAITSEGATTYQIAPGSAFLELGRGTLFGFGYPVFLALVLCLAGGLALRRTRFGQSVFATGGAEQSARLMGLPVARTKVAVYVMSGTLSGFAGALTAAYLQSGVTVIGVGLELDAIAAVVIGGTLLTGGMGTVLGTVIGVALRTVIQNVINQIGTLDSNYQSVVSGAFLLVVVVLQRSLAARGGRGG